MKRPALAANGVQNPQSSSAASATARFAASHAAIPVVS